MLIQKNKKAKTLSENTTGPVFAQLSVFKLIPDNIHFSLCASWLQNVVWTAVLQLCWKVKLCRLTLALASNELIFWANKLFWITFRNNSFFSASSWSPAVPSELREKQQEWLFSLSSQELRSTDNQEQIHTNERKCTQSSLFWRSWSESNSVSRWKHKWFSECTDCIETEMITDSSAFANGTNYWLQGAPPLFLSNTSTAEDRVFWWTSGTLLFNKPELWLKSSLKSLHFMKNLFIQAAPLWLYAMLGWHSLLLILNELLG